MRVDDRQMGIKPVMSGLGPAVPIARTRVAVTLTAFIMPAAKWTIDRR
jgi:hypothetical protein